MYLYLRLRRRASERRFAFIRLRKELSGLRLLKRMGQEKPLPLPCLLKAYL